MHVDKGCQETLDLRAQGNPGEPEAAHHPSRRPKPATQPCTSPRTEPTRLCTAKENPKQPRIVVSLP